MDDGWLAIAPVSLRQLKMEHDEPQPHDGFEEVLALGSAGRFRAAVLVLIRANAQEPGSLSRQALCAALLALLATAEWRLSEMRGYVKLAVLASSRTTCRESADDRYLRQLARALACKAALLAGSTARAKRILGTIADGDSTLAGLIEIGGGERVPAVPALSHYGPFVARVAAAAMSYRKFGLTTAETAILRTLSDGSTLSAIAVRLSKKRKTVDHQVQSIYSKLGVNNRVQAIVLAREHDLL